MAKSKKEIRDILHAHGLRATAPRLAVISLLQEAGRPLSYTEVLSDLGNVDWDTSTVYRNLVRLCAAGLVTMVGRIDGADRYALVLAQVDHHDHPHFFCRVCAKVMCLPGSRLVLPKTAGDGWDEAIKRSTVQFKGVCPECKNKD